MLSSYRVLDLSDERGQLCGHILASLGAEVILVEPPGGSPARRVAPFVDGRAGDHDGSLTFLAFNRGKRSVVLDLASPVGQADLRRLAADADFMIDSNPGELAALGFGHDYLAALNPRLISVSISAFGAGGPKAAWRATDLIVAASAGQASVTGDSDRSPLRIGVPQAFHHAAAEAAGAALIALYEREHRSGLGQHVDVSAQQALLQATQSMMLAHPLNASLIGRMAGGVRIGKFDIQLMWPCRDGYVSVTFLFGAALGPFSRNLMEWVCEAGFCDAATRDKDWIQYANLLFGGVEPPEEYERVKRVLAAFLASKTKAELLEASFARRLLITPVTTTAEVVDSPQLRERDFWQEVGGIRYPGSMAKLSETPLALLGPPPSPGADTADVLAAPRRSSSPRAAPVAGLGSAGSASRALEGLKVLDLMWVMAGPAGSRVLADHGATVVRIESANRIDTARTLQPFRDDGIANDSSGLFNNMNAGKLGVAIDLSKPGAKEVVLDLVRWADVVVESFSPRGMRSMGLEYETLRQVKPDIVMLSSCLMGQTGPLSSLAGFGTMAAAISGFFNVTGWPDRPPSGPFGAYTDYVSPRLLVAVLMAAVEHRRATGQGQYIDLSQAECSLQFLAPALLEYTVNGRVVERCGNDDPVYAPHGVYPASGTDRWLAVAITNDSEWASLCELMGRADLSTLDGTGRRQRRRDLDSVVGGWTASRDAATLMVELQGLGIPAHEVQNSVECFNDPQLVHRHHFWEVGHAAQGTTWVEGPRAHLSRTPAFVTYGAPTSGEHTWDVLTEILGYDPDRIADLAVAGLLE